MIGVAQRTWHLNGDEFAPEPLEMQAEVAAAAMADARSGGDLAAAVDGLGVVHCLSWPYDDPAGRLAAAIGISPGTSACSSMSGTVGQHFVGAAADRIAAGESDVELVVGAEALDTKRRLKKVGERPAWSHRNPEPPGMPFDTPFHDAEVAHEVFQAWLTFACSRHRTAGPGSVPHRSCTGSVGGAVGATERGCRGKPACLVPDCSHGFRSGHRNPGQPNGRLSVHQEDGGGDGR